MIDGAQSEGTPEQSGGRGSDGLMPDTCRQQSGTDLAPQRFDNGCVSGPFDEGPTPGRRTTCFAGAEYDRASTS